MYPMAIVHLVFPILFSVLVCFTSKNNWSFMHKFRLAMLNRQKARKLFSLLVISLMLLLHYLYVTIFPCNWGVIMSSIVCAILFSYKFMEAMLLRINTSMKVFFVCAMTSVAVLYIPGLYTIGCSMAVFLLAASLYPTQRAFARWEDSELREECYTSSQILLKLYNS